MKITYREDRILNFKTILDLEQCRKELLQAYPELAGMTWTLQFFNESDNEYYSIDTTDDYDGFIVDHDSNKTLQVKVNVTSDTKELDICSISSIQAEKKQQGDKEGSQFGNGPFEPIEDQGLKKAQRDWQTQRMKDNYTRSIKTQPNETRQPNYEVLFSKNKDKPEVIEVEDQKQVRQFNENVQVVNEYSRSNQPKGNYSKQSVIANKNEGSLKERSEVRIGRSVQSSKIREANRNNRPIDRIQQEQQPQSTCSFCRKSTHHLYYLHAFHNIKLCESCDKHYQIKSAKSIQPNPLLCNFCGTRHGAMFQVGTFDLFSCAACSRVWEITVKDQPVMGSGMKINRYE